MKNCKIILYCFLQGIAVHSSAQPKIVATLRDWGPKSGGTVLRMDLPGMSPGPVYSFDNTKPHDPSTGVCAGDLDWLYGVTGSGGSNRRGTFYRVRQDGTLLTTLYHFSNNFGNNTVPIYHTDGFVYFGDGDSIRKYNTANGSINGMMTGAIIESKNMVIDDDDWIYYIEKAFPSRLAKMNTDGSIWNILHDFVPANDGEDGIAGVTEVPGDSLFGLMKYGGINSGGTLYSIRKDGTGFRVHHQFTTATGINPESKLTYFDGKLFGTTTLGGNFNMGVLFSINADGSNYRVLRHFEVGTNGYDETPGGNIAVSSDGKIFGGFRNWLFTNFVYYYLYKVDTSGSNFTPFFSGNGFSIQRENGEGNQDILLLEDEDIYFPARYYGRNDGGVLNLVDTSGVGSAILQYGNSPTGFHPTGIIKASDGKLYGTTIIGGPEGSGVIFSMNADGTGYAVLHQFTDAQGFEPSGKLLEASDGKLYGGCRQGGPAGLGSIYRINKNGTFFEIIYDYTITPMAYSPVGDLIEGPGGSLYGVNFWPYGSVFKVDKNGNNYMDLRVFAPGDLTNPYTGVRLIRNYLYGTCGYGGAGNYGAIYRIKTDGSGYQVLHEFNDITDGNLPVGTPLLASNGKLFGTTAYGGSDFNGYIYRIDTTGANFTVIRDLSSADGGNPWMSMIQASDGLIYGGSQTGGTTGGTIFRFDTTGGGFIVVRNLEYETEGAGVSSLLDLNGNFTLPVELISFKADKQNQTVLLTWKTAQEQNSDRFEIERSSNGTEFNTKGSVAAAGNTNSITNYSFKDIDPMNGINYYRLKQVDKDGSFTYSRTVTVSFDAGKNLIVFPNPVSDRLYIRLPQQNRYATIRILDASGKMVLQRNIGSSATAEVNVDGLPKGWYILQLIGDNKLEKSFLKE
ncbi:MAG: choice-of-anchor tandem repeat GloVer-containing protein [Chitinophagales bacterium]